MFEHFFEKQEIISNYFTYYYFQYFFIPILFKIFEDL